nr:MAG TPA: hypothetical protein [Caudoviricetes sp.]
MHLHYLVHQAHAAGVELVLDVALKLVLPRASRGWLDVERHHLPHSVVKGEHGSPLYLCLCRNLNHNLALFYLDCVHGNGFLLTRHSAHVKETGLSFTRAARLGAASSPARAARNHQHYIHIYILSVLFASLFGYRFAYHVQKLAQHTQGFFSVGVQDVKRRDNRDCNAQEKLSGLQASLYVVVGKNIHHAIAQFFRPGRINIGADGLQPLPEIFVLHISISGITVLNSTSPLGPKV